MFLEVIAKSALGKVVGTAVAPATEFFDAFLGNEKAFRFATEKLRPKYEQTVQPASYDNIVTNLRLTKQDYLDYFRETSAPGSPSLAEFLRQQIRTRAEKWTLNRPPPELLDCLIDDFYQAFEAYYLTTDPALATLHLVEVSTDMLVILEDIRRFYEGEKAKATDKHTGQLAEDISTFLSTLNIPFTTLEKTDRHVDLVLTDPSSILPARFYLCACRDGITTAILDDLLNRSRHHGRFSQVILVTEMALSADAVADADRRNITLFTMEQLRERFMALGPEERYVIGSVAAEGLARTLNVHELYVPPDAVEARPGEIVEDEYLTGRQPALELINRFLESDDERILFVLGGYGTGKSALCAHLTQVLSRGGTPFMPVYIGLQQLRSADDLTRVVIKGEQLCQTIAGSGKRALVLLDGLDELSNAMSSEEKRRNVLRLLEASTRTDRSGKFLITARASYFRGLQDFWNFFERPKDSPLASKLLRNIHGYRPRVAAIVLSEFNYTQVDAYVREFGRKHNRPGDFPETFFAEMDRNDPRHTYRGMTRNPLYLYLLLNNEPWNVEGVTCFADVIHEFIQYWMHRDIAKGKSRWLLVIQDRLAFFESVAWYLFEKEKSSLEFGEHDQLVGAFLKNAADASHQAAISLDLQTTGVFSCTGNRLYFAIRAFQDYFISLRLLRLTFERAAANEWPMQVPNTEQTYLWLGQLESEKEFPSPIDAAAILRRMGLAAGAEHEAKLSLSPTGILCGQLPADWDWPHVNSFEYTQHRILANAWLARRHRTEQFQLRITTSLGLHLRTIAFVSKRLREWQCKFPPDKHPTITLGFEDREADAGSCLGLLELAVPGECNIGIKHSDCTPEDVEDWLRTLGAVPLSEGGGVWVTNFNGAYRDDQ